MLTLVYYGCPMLCTQVLNGLVERSRPLSFNAGDEFDVVTVSFDPSTRRRRWPPTKKRRLRRSATQRPSAEAAGTS